MLKNFDKILFLLSAVLAMCGIAFAAGLYNGANRTALYWAIIDIRDDLALVFEERETLLRTDTPIHYLQPSRRDGSGVTVNARPDDDKLILMSGFFGDSNGLKLIRRDGTVVAEWTALYSEHFPDPAFLDVPPASDRNVDLHGALIHPDGSVVFNYEYSGTVKLSRCNVPLWTLEHPTHHSVELSQKGGYWIPGRLKYRPGEGREFLPFTRRKRVSHFLEDLILRVDDNGNIIDQQSVPGLMYNNGLETILTSKGISVWQRQNANFEFMHINKIGELPAEQAAAFPDFEAGDLLISERTYNLVLVVDPDTWKVKWHQTVPWLHQHDPEFSSDGTILIFNNNKTRPKEGTPQPLEQPQVSNIIKVDPRTGRTEVVYGQQDGEEMMSVIRGKHEITPGGGLLVTEFEGGRVFETDADRQIVWEYINRYSPEEVLEITEARIYPSDYFTVQDWNCS